MPATNEAMGLPSETRRTELEYCESASLLLARATDQTGRVRLFVRSLIEGRYHEIGQTPADTGSFFTSRLNAKGDTLYAVRHDSTPPSGWNFHSIVRIELAHNVSDTVLEAPSLNGDSISEILAVDCAERILYLAVARRRAIEEAGTAVEYHVEAFDIGRCTFRHLGPLPGVVV